MNRRELLKRVVQTSFGILLSPFLSVPIRPLYGQTVSNDFDIGIVTGNTKAALKKAVSLVGGMKKYVKPGDTVVLKPNMGFPNPPEMASTTNPDVITATAGLCIDAGAKKVLIVDHPLRRPEVCLRRNGIQNAVKEMKNVHVFAITGSQFFKSVKVPNGKVLQEVDILKDVLNADVLINMPIAKSHMATGVTLGMKGLMGIIYNREYFHEKVDLDQAIADLNTVVKPALTIVDATRIMTSGGPAGPGTVEQLDTIVAGTDPVAVDASAVALAKWYGHQFEAKNVKHILNAHEMGIGEINTDRLKVKRTTLDGQPGG